MKYFIIGEKFEWIGHIKSMPRTGGTGSNTDLSEARASVPEGGSAVPGTASTVSRSGPRPGPQCPDAPQPGHEPGQRSSSRIEVSTWNERKSAQRSVRT